MRFFIIYFLRSKVSNLLCLGLKKGQGKGFRQHTLHCPLPLNTNFSGVSGIIVAKISTGAMDTREIVQTVLHLLPDF